MKYTLIALAGLLTFGLAGCGSSGDVDSAVKPGSGVAMNPSGKPQTQADAEFAQKMQQAGNAINADRMRQAAAMRDAQTRSGGK